jgi:Leucine-rich repeat (LRR) protein
MDVRNYVNELSEYFDLQKIQNLDLRGIGLGFLSEEELAGNSYKNIITLNLSQNVMKKVSSSLILRYPKLQNLDVNSNCLTSLNVQDRIAFNNLLTLNLSRNSISNINPFVFSNISLEIVDLSFNLLLKFLAADFEIKQLHITDNKLTQIEIDSKHHKELKLLDASNNDLKIFQINVDLNNLVLSGNQLTMDEYFSIRNVYGTLDLSRNHISEFNWKYITCTTNLNLAHNYITVFQVECPANKKFVF